MTFDGSLQCLAEVLKQHSSAKIYLMQSRKKDGSYVFDPLHGSPVLVIEARTEQPGRIFEIGMEIQ